MSTVPKEAHRRVSDLLELMLQVVRTHLMWVLGTKLRSFGRAMQAPDL